MKIKKIKIKKQIIYIVATALCVVTTIVYLVYINRPADMFFKSAEEKEDSEVIDSEIIDSEITYTHNEENEDNEENGESEPKQATSRDTMMASIREIQVANDQEEGREMTELEKSAESDKIEESEETIKDEETESPEPIVEKIMVHVVGAVINQGVYELDKGSRIIDAVNAAGGLAENADQESINMSKYVHDTQQIKIFTTEENWRELLAIQENETELETGIEIETGIDLGEELTDIDVSSNAQYVSASATATSNVTNNEAEQQPPEETPRPGEYKDGKIDINRASRKTLTTLPGVGDTIAGYIIEYRESNGGFGSIDELKNVQRIGQKTFDGLKHLITV